MTRLADGHPTGLVGFQYAMFFALLLSGVPALSAAEGPMAPLPWNWQANKENCPEPADAVWVDYPNGQDCIRYFTGGDVIDAPVAIIIFRGDRTGAAHREPENIRYNTPHEQRAVAERLARQTNLPVVIVARPGTYGSSGDHAKRRQLKEFLALDAALDAIRVRHGISRLVLVGHSGGATAAAALLTLGRNDISCAVLTSGAYALLERARILREQNGQKVRPGLDTTGLPSPYDPLEHIGGIVHDADRKIIVIGNLKDRVTPFRLQEKFVLALRGNGHAARLKTHSALPPKYHDLKGSVGLKTAARCAKGED